MRNTKWILAFVLAGMFSAPAMAQQTDLSGTWTGNDGGTYSIGQSGTTVAWYGQESIPYPTFADAAAGTLPENPLKLGDTWAMAWAFVPIGTATGGGTLHVTFNSPSELAVSGDSQLTKLTRGTSRKK